MIEKLSIPNCGFKKEHIATLSNCLSQNPKPAVTQFDSSDNLLEGKPNTHTQTHT
jgi:hypothetical protein